ncbi:MAG: outer membrane beta-barrel protein [bacterium]
MTQKEWAIHFIKDIRKVEDQASPPRHLGRFLLRSKAISIRASLTTYWERAKRYLSFNLYGKYQLRSKSIVPYFLAGPRFDVLLNKQVSRLFDDVYDSLKNTAYGLSVGLGAEIANMRPFVVLAEVRYNLDLSKSLDSDGLTIKNRAFDLRLGLKF